jgi:hypothetical protein
VAKISKLAIVSSDDCAALKFLIIDVMQSFFKVNKFLIFDSFAKATDFTASNAPSCTGLK